MTRRILLLGVAGLVICMLSCEIEQETRSTYNLVNDPPSFFTVAQVDGRFAPVKVIFTEFTEQVRVQNTQPSPLPASLEKPPAERRLFGATIIDPKLPSWHVRWGGREGIKYPWGWSLPPGQELPPEGIQYPWGWSFPPVLPASSGDAPGASIVRTAAGEDPGTIFISGFDTGTVSALNGSSGALATLIRTGSGAAGIAFSADGRSLLVATAAPPVLNLINASTRAVTGSIPLPPASTPFAVDVTPDGAMAYVTSASRDNPRIYAVDLARRAVVADLLSGGYPNAVRVSPDGSQAWVSVLFDDAILVIDTLTNTLMARVDNIINPREIDFNPTGTRAWVASSTESTATVKVIDTASFRVVGSVPVGDQPMSVRVTPSGRHVFVTSLLSENVTQIDAATASVVRSIRVGRGAQGIDFVP